MFPKEVKIEVYVRFPSSKNWSNLQLLNAALTATEQENLLVAQITMAPPTKEVS